MNMRCIKDYLVKTFPTNYVVRTGETCVIEGYLMGRDIVLRPDPVLHPSDYKHLPYQTFVVFEESELREHFIKEAV